MTETLNSAALAQKLRNHAMSQPSTQPVAPQVRRNYRILSFDPHTGVGSATDRDNVYFTISKDSFTDGIILDLIRNDLVSASVIRQTELRDIYLERAAGSPGEYQ
jgi:hypothetical protein